MFFSFRRSLLASVCGVTLLTASCPAGQLAGSFTDLPVNSTINLTTEGSADWIHWGEENSRTVNRKAGVGPQISGVTVIPGTNNYYISYFRETDSTVRCSWSDGTPTLARTNSTNYIWMYSANPIRSGFRLSAPADTRPRTLKLYVGGQTGNGTLTARLSDSSAAPYTNTFEVKKPADRFYSLTYAANSPGQRLEVDWVLASGNGNNPHISIQAATLAAPGVSKIPLVTITTPTNVQSFTTSAIPVTIAASDLDGVVTNVAVYVDGVWQDQRANAPWTFSLTNLSPGFHTLTAIATDDAGESSMSSPVEIHVYQGNNLLGGSLTKFPAGGWVLPVDLSAEGTLDWINWGLYGATNMDRKAAVTPRVSNYLHSGTNTPGDLLEGSYCTWSWTDGSPTAVNFYSDNGIQLQGDTNGFKLLLASDAQGRKAKIYLGDYGSRAAVRAYFTNHSAPAYYQNYNLVDIYATIDGVFEVQYASAEPRTVAVQIEASELYDINFAGTRLMSATVQPDLSLILPFKIESQQSVPEGSVLSFFTQPGIGYYVECTPELTPPVWTTITNVLGSGGLLTLTNPPVADQAYYRVRAQ